MRRYIAICTILLTLIATSSASRCAETFELAEAVRQLDAESFAERQAASAALRRLGAKAHEALAEAAQQGSAEVRTRALAILTQHLTTGDLHLQESARATLEKLAGGDDTAARLAYSILNPTQPTSNDWARLARLPALQQRRANVRVQMGLQIRARPQMPAAVRRYSLNLNENGRKITVKGSEEGIQIEIEETDKDGQKVTKRYEAKNEAELEAKHPEAHAIFKDVRQRFGLRDPNP